MGDVEVEYSVYLNIILIFPQFSSAKPLHQISNILLPKHIECIVNNVSNVNLLCKKFLLKLLKIKFFDIIVALCSITEHNHTKN